MRRLLTYSLLLCTMLSFAQAKKVKDNNLPKGNEEFLKKNYVDAEADYRISQSKQPTRATAAYNLGNAIYRQNQNAEAFNAYANALKNATTKQQKHMANHNIGNVFMKEKKYQEAVEAYKNALRNNPADEQSRYNLALAKKMLKDNPPPPPKPDDKKDDKKDPKKDDKNQKPEKPKEGDEKDKGDKGDNKDNKDKGDDKDKDKGDKGDDKKDKGDKGDQKDEGKDKGKPEEGPSPSKQRMENLLDAMNNEEKKIQDKIQAKKVKVQSKKQEKDW